MNVRWLTSCIGMAAASAGAQIVISPNSRATTEGNDGNAYPFAAPELVRYQQAFGPGSLSTIAGRQITQIAFRLDSSHVAPYAGGFAYPHIVMRMSTSPRTPDTLSTVMDSNVGADVRTVHSGPFTLPTLSAGAAPRPFDLVINLEQPFVYLGGTLLVDIDGGLGPTQSSAFYLDSEWTTGDAVGRVYLVAASTPFADTRGLIARFTAAPIQCYANCDGSTVAPILNVGDFSCFLNKFAAGDSYANCDGSTVVPVLNVLDFTCFLNRFSAGC